MVSDPGVNPLSVQCQRKLASWVGPAGAWQDRLRNPLAKRGAGRLAPHVPRGRQGRNDKGCCVLVLVFVLLLVLTLARAKEQVLAQG